MNAKGYLQTGQITCHDVSGREVPCQGSGQDAEFRKGIPWTSPRFELRGDVVLDNLTGLTWTHDANPAEFPLRWQEALDYVSSLNDKKAFGYSDWRLPNRRELRSLMSHQTKKPALPDGHPFINIFLGWYWTSTTAAINTAYAWYIHLEGARMFYGNKEQFFLLWPCRGKGSQVLPATGQTLCYDTEGNPVPCIGAGQDGEFRFGRKWPEPRFEPAHDFVIDHLTGLCWHKNADLTGGLATWNKAFEAIAALNLKTEKKVCGVSPISMNWNLSWTAACIVLHCLQTICFRMFRKVIGPRQRAVSRLTGPGLYTLPREP